MDRRTRRRCDAAMTLHARIEAAIRLLYPDEMTPTARNVLLRILEDETDGGQ